MAKLDLGITRGLVKHYHALRDRGTSAQEAFSAVFQTAFRYGYRAGVLGAKENAMQAAYSVVLADMKERLACGPNDEAGIGAYEVLHELTSIAAKD